VMSLKKELSLNICDNQNKKWLPTDEKMTLIEIIENKKQF